MSDSEHEEHPRPDIRARMRDGALIDAAMRAAGRDAARRHKAMGVPLVVWVNGEIREIPPEEIEVEPEPGDTPVPRPGGGSLG